MTESVKQTETQTVSGDTSVKSVCLISLGCSKNLVDSEAMAGIISGEGFSITGEPAEADVIIVNTCGFIESAKQEAIDKILEMADHKHQKKGPGGLSGKGRCEYLIVTGCLAQRYASEIADSLPEVDAVLGTYQYSSIVSTIKELYSRKQDHADISAYGCGPIVLTGNENSMKHLDPERMPSTSGFAYIKIAEGCSNNCSYCAIPGIRGRFISRPLEELVKEAECLAEKGFYEIVLIAQDTTGYGQDLCGRRSLAELVRRISAVGSIRKIRLLYCYADGITPELIHEIADNPKVAKYIDIPIQHVSDNVLKRMKRRDTSSSIGNIIMELRKKIPEITLRTTVMTGFPGETEADFSELLGFISRTKFDLLGCFIFSPEEGTAAYDMRPRVPKSTARRRYDQIMKLQKDISLERNLAKIGSIYKVTIDSAAPDGVFYLGRGDAQAPEIDPPVYVIASDDDLETGREYDIRIVDCTEYELTGVTCS